MLFTCVELASASVRQDVLLLFYFFFQAEDGIRDLTVTGVQTCALPIFGAVAGALIGELILIKACGLLGTSLCAAFLNVVAAIFALILARAGSQPTRLDRKSVV